MSDRIAVMRSGRILQEGTPTDLYDEPLDRFVADFIGESNLFEGVVEEAGERVTVRTDGGVVLRARIPTGADELRSGERAVVSLRPERVHVELVGGSSDGDRTSTLGRVEQRTFLGDQVEFRVDTPTLGHVTARTNHRPGSPEARFGPGDEVRLGWMNDVALALRP